MTGAVAELLFRSSLLLGFAALVRRAIARKGPASQHLIVSLSFLFLLLLPFYQLLLPSLTVLLPGGSFPGTSVTVESTFRTASGTQPLPWAALMAIGIWLSGAGIASASLLIGYLHAYSLRRRGQPVAPELASTLLAELGVRTSLNSTPRMLLFVEAIMPQICGLWHPWLLLPREFLTWPHDRKRAVLLHELSHIERHDMLWRLLAHVTTALWWFQPLCWQGRRWLKNDSEQACDALVLASGMQPSTYASELVTVARTMRTSPAAGLLMAECSSLESRLQAILAGNARSQPQRHPAAYVALLLVTALGCSIVSVAPGDPSIVQGGVSMRRTLFSSMFTGLLVSAGLTSASPSRAGLAATAGTSVQAEPVRSGAAPNTPAKPIRVSGRVAQENLISKVPPVYPPAAKAAHVQGAVQLEATISAEGLPQDVHVVSSPSDDLSQSALEAVRQWRYRPTLLNGNPVEIVTDITVTYTLQP